MEKIINVGGRPLKFKTRDDLIKVINEYFKDTEMNQYSVTGLALVVGSKQLIQDYEKRKDFKDIILEAKLIVENSYELSLRGTGGAHNIFALKNFGWKDKQELDHTSKGKQIFGGSGLVGDALDDALESKFDGT